MSAAGRTGEQVGRVFPFEVATDPVFSPQECDRIIALGTERARSKGTEGQVLQGRDGYRAKAERRRSRIVWLDGSGETAWIQQRVVDIAQKVNQQVWQFELNRAEPLQFARYAEAEHYDWHTDIGTGLPILLRKLSLTVQLSDPEDYDGGNLQFQTAMEPYAASRERGAAVLFPSYVMHRVTPVLRGERYSLVQWFLGDRPFR